MIAQKTKCVRTETGLQTSIQNRVRSLCMRQERCEVVHARFHARVDDRITIIYRIRALPSKAFRTAFVGDLLTVTGGIVRFCENDFRRFSLGSIGQKQSAGLESSLVISKFSDIENVTRLER